MNPQKLIVSGLFIWVSCIANALSLPPDYVPPTYDQRWDAADLVVYGRVTRLELIENDEQPGAYELSFHIEQVWKGDSVGKVTFKETLPNSGMGTGYHFGFYRTYIIFAAKSQIDGSYERQYAQPAVYPLPDKLFGGDIHRFALVEFLEIKSGNQSEASKLQAIRKKAAQEKQAVINDAKMDFESAMKEQGVPERLTLLEKLSEKLNALSLDELRPLKQKVSRELNVARNYSANGLKEFN